MPVPYAFYAFASESCSRQQTHLSHHVMKTKNLLSSSGRLVLFAFVVIAQSGYFGLGFTTLTWKAALQTLVYDLFLSMEK